MARIVVVSAGAGVLFEQSVTHGNKDRPERQPLTRLFPALLPAGGQWSDTTHRSYFFASLNASTFPSPVAMTRSPPAIAGDERMSSPTSLDQISSPDSVSRA